MTGVETSTANPVAWQSPNPASRLGDKQIDVWRRHLDQPDEVVARLAAMLTPAERARADRFHFDRDRRRHIVGRATLRGILGRTLVCAPADIALAETLQGKLHLEGASPSRGVTFNLTHSGEIALYAVSRDRRLGIDVEADRDDIDLGLARRVFSPAERAVLAALPPAEQGRAFLRGWTRKEAYVKADGQGLGLPLRDITVSIAPDAPAALLDGVAPEWRLAAFVPAAGYVAALCHDGGPSTRHYLCADAL